MLARFERLVEQAVEGSLRRVFPTNLQPVQLAKAAARAMDEAQVIGLYGADVPNAYRVHLAPEDLERFGEYRTTLTRELTEYLVEYAHDRGLRPVSAPRVELTEDERQRVGAVHVEARFVDVAPERQAALDEALEGTRRLRLADLANARQAAAQVDAGTLWLTDRLGLRYPLEPQAGIVRIGRAVDNDVSINNQRISRYHAQVRLVQSAWLVYDLDSTNGTFVDGERVFPSQPQRLHTGAELRLGDHELQLERHEKADQASAS